MQPACTHWSGQYVFLALLPDRCCARPFAGLVLAAETNRSVVLPDWLLRGYMPDAVKYVTADDGGAVSFGWVSRGAAAGCLGACAH